jgi:hypothetical protein
MATCYAAKCCVGRLARRQLQPSWRSRAWRRLTPLRQPVRRWYTSFLPYISPVSKDRVGKKGPPYDETYVLSENLFAAAEVAGDKKYYDL